MALEGRMHFAVRPLPAHSGLDGAFRIHIPPEQLDVLGLRVGDVCEVSGGEHGTDLLGHGIAWRATEKLGANPKQKPAKMTDTLRHAFNIKEGSHVNLSPSRAKIARADKVVLTDVTPTEFLNGDAAETEDEKWWWRCGHTLSNCEAFASGTNFDVTARKGIRKRFHVEHVDAATTAPGIPALFYFNDHTKLVINGLDVTPNTTAANGDHHGYAGIDAKHIGGLLDQIKTLNASMKRVIEDTRAPQGLTRHAGVLIHGYEGTGKSMLLSRMKRAPFRKVLYLDELELDSPSASKNQAHIESTFTTALDNQPSLILIDDLHELAPANGSAYGKALTKQFNRLNGAQVLVVATCRNPDDVFQRLIGVGLLSRNVELPVPDHVARIDILDALLDGSDTEADVARDLGRRTHGFTGRDLALLITLAREQAVEQSEAREEFESRDLPNHESMSSLLISFDGAANNQAVAKVDATQAQPKEKPLITITTEDFDYALTQVRPTALREFLFEKPQIQWSDIGGSQAIKERFDHIIGWPLDYAEDMTTLRLESTKGILLYGPPGCSKTMTAQAVAKTYDLNFIAVQGAELISMYVGESERAIRNLFSKARAAAPCVVFFDEIDSIASVREGGASKGLNVLTTLLNEMDGFRPLNNVIILAATNKPEVLDSAIMRPGRFDAQIYLGPPDTLARQEIFSIQMKGVPKGGYIDFIRFVRATDGFTGAEIKELCNLAKERAFVRAHGAEAPAELQLLEEDFEYALPRTKKRVSVDMIEAYLAFAGKQSS
ncbi:P-loop containing nucleoside triphosphate hydrolase protein [Neohortaea acidophila]|uniref:P-loop containing nucleoside triphosphate hydrolase protein n=1 Tax=Neohortaea acidophila TaxID=245834 RepID=A0A6A6Q7C5_9PEZI|nr:P-loop containing nucleoside triphosphate hydrolase protein [Neohortaea acidophila]KAF2487543.1 P-loop containing nucleoside triphosphate hydrolase protein [Neohortaea acidophila]